MKTAAEIETEIIRMGDVAVAIEMVDSVLSDGKVDQAERAVIILKELFERRYDRLCTCIS